MLSVDFFDLALLFFERVFHINNPWSVFVKLPDAHVDRLHTTRTCSLRLLHCLLLGYRELSHIFPTHKKLAQGGVSG